jgi:hypothetical protein
MKRRCKVVGCKAQLTNPENLYCSIHIFRRSDRNEISERNVGGKPKK